MYHWKRKFLLKYGSRMIRMQTRDLDQPRLGKVCGLLVLLLMIVRNYAYYRLSVCYNADSSSR